MNAPVMVELEGETDPLKIAMKELKLVVYISKYIKFKLLKRALKIFMLLHISDITTCHNQTY